MTADSGIERFQSRFNVSRETLNRLKLYEDLVRKWNPAINLVSRSTVADIWDRHFADSAQAYYIAAPETGHWIDLGSGGGFPGAVVAILAKEFHPGLSVACIDSDSRKCEFIRTLSRRVEIPIGVHSQRVKDMPPQNADYVSARAVAPLPRLLPLVHRHLSATGTAVLHKGAKADEEIEAALESWRFTVEKRSSPLNPDSVILRIGDLAIG